MAYQVPWTFEHLHANAACKKCQCKDMRLTGVRRAGKNTASYRYTCRYCGTPHSIREPIPESSITPLYGLPELFSTRRPGAQQESEQTPDGAETDRYAKDLIRDRLGWS